MLLRPNLNAGFEDGEKRTQSTRASSNTKFLINLDDISSETDALFKVKVKVKVAVVSVPVSNSYELLPRTSAGKPQPPITMPNRDSNLPVISGKLTTLGGD